MAKTEAQKRANKKYDAEHMKYFTLSMRKEFSQKIDDFLVTDEGKQYKSKSAFIVEAVREKFDAIGFPGGGEE